MHARAVAKLSERRRARQEENRAALAAHPDAGRYAWMEPEGTHRLLQPVDGRVIVVDYDGTPHEATAGEGTAFFGGCAERFENANTHGWYALEDFPAVAQRWVDIVRGRGDAWRLRADGPHYREWRPVGLSHDRRDRG